MQEQGKGKAKNKSKSKGGKAKAKAKGKANAGNVRDGSPQRELSDPWDDLRNAWAVEYLQSTQGSQVTHQNQNQNQQQNQQKRQKKQNNQNSHPKGQQSGSASAQNRRGRGNRAHAPKQQKQQKKNPNPNPNGQQSESASAQKRRGRGEGGHVHAGQKRKTTESVTNDITDTDDADRGRAPKRHKSERRPQPPPSPSPSSPEPGAAARPHPDFWHPDGSVIIQIERTKFRLHQSMLKRDSAYFATVFQKGSHKHGGRAYLEVEVDERSPNGHHLPVYRIAETTANDFATLLSVMEGNWKYTDDTPPMPVLAGVLRAARALAFKVQREWAERIFERMWPEALDTLTMDPIPHAAVALALARTCGLRGVQKRASYELLRMPTFGQTIVAAPAAHVEVEGDSRADVDMGADELPWADLLRLLHAREQLVLTWAEIAGKPPTDFVCPRGTQTQIIPESGGGGGTSSGKCVSGNADRVHARWAELVHTTGLYVGRMVDPIMGLRDLMKIPWRDEGFCKKCVAARMNSWDESRKQIWDDLDVWLQLPSAENI